MKKKLSNRLTLKKETLSNLTNHEMNNLRGGTFATNGCTSYVTTADCASIICTGSENCTGSGSGQATACYCE